MRQLAQTKLDVGVLYNPELCQEHVNQKCRDWCSGRCFVAYATSRPFYAIAFFALVRWLSCTTFVTNPISKCYLVGVNPRLKSEEKARVDRTYEVMSSIAL